MSNMSYCRWQNTLSDLKDCYNNLHDPALNKDDREMAARKALIELCATIVEEAMDDDGCVRYEPDLEDESTEITLRLPNRFFKVKATGKTGLEIGDIFVDVRNGSKYFNRQFEINDFIGDFVEVYLYPIEYNVLDHAIAGTIEDQGQR